MFRFKHIATDILKQINTKPLIIATHIVDNFDKLKYKIKDTKIIYDPFLIQRLEEYD